MRNGSRLAHTGYRPRFLALGGVVVLLGAALPGRLTAQSAAGAPVSHGATRHLHGVVESESGRPLRDAEILVTFAGNTGGGSASARTGRTMRARSDGNGRFDLRDLPAAMVVVQVRALGYTAFRQELDLTAADRLLTVHLEPAVTRLANVAVRADTSRELLERVAATSTLDRTALARMRGQTLGETIKQLPGVAVIQFGPSIAKPVVRGLNSQRVLVLNGGLRQEDQQWGTEHAPNIDGFEADAVTVVRGAATVLYGADALGGVVRVDPAPLPDTGAFRGTVALQSFSNSRQGALSTSLEGADLTLPVIGTTGYRLRLTSRVAGNSAAPDYALTNTGFRELNGSAAFGVTRSWGTAAITVTRFGTALGVLRQAHVGNVEDLQRVMAGAPPDSAFSYAIGRPSQNVSHTTLRARALLALPRAQQLELVYGFQLNERREFDNHGPLRFRDEPAFFLRLFTNSLDARWSHARTRGFKGTVGSSLIAQGNQTRGKAFLIPGYDLWQGALYAQEEWAHGRLSVVSGLRGDVISQTTIAYADQGIRSPAGTRAWQNISGSVGAAYLLRDGLDFSLRVARAWRPPTVNERYAQGVHHGTAQYELGDASLARERSHGLEASLRYRHTSLSLEAATYDNRIDGFIYLRPTAPVQTIRGAFPGFRYAQTSARMRGAELAATYTPYAQWQLLLNGTLVRGTDRLTSEPLFDMPADRVTLSTRLVGTRARIGDWYVGGGALLVRRQDGVPSGTIYTLPTAGYALAQFEAGANAVRLAGRALDLSLSVTNALNARYRDYLSRYRLFVNDPGRDIVLRASLPFRASSS
jgi:iron complex outermembrane recepter protein